jgi:transposase InsO family protein
LKVSDFTQKRIGNGDTGYVFGLLDMNNDVFVTLAGHPEKSGDIVVKNLELLKQIQSQEQKIEIRSDRGKEFYNELVRKFCDENNMLLHFIPKGSPWLQAFIERGFSNYQGGISKPCMDWNKFNDVLQDARYGYNHRPNSAFDYRSP